MKYFVCAAILLGIILSCGVDSTLNGNSRRPAVMPCSVTQIGDQIVVMCPDGTQATIPAGAAQPNLAADGIAEEEDAILPEEVSPIKITVCHKPGTSAEQTKDIPINALRGHLNHGDYIGECDNG